MRETRCFVAVRDVWPGTAAVLGTVVLRDRARACRPRTRLGKSYLWGMRGCRGPGTIVPMMQRNLKTQLSADKTGADSLFDSEPELSRDPNASVPEPSEVPPLPISGGEGDTSPGHLGLSEQQGPEFLKRFSEPTRTLIIDGAIAVALMLFSWAEVSLTQTLYLVFREGHVFSGFSGFNVTPLFLFLLALEFLPLVMRRLQPSAVLIVTAAVYLVIQATEGTSIAIIAPMLALYTLATTRPRVETFTWGAALMALFIVVPFALDSSTTLLYLIQNFALLFASAAFGDSVRSRQELTEEAMRRAEEAERTREEVAARRVEAERVRIAREVHDITAHSLSIVTIQAAAAERLVDIDVQGAREALLAIRSTSKDALQELRALVGVLREPLSAPEKTPTSGTERLPEVIRSLEGSAIEVSIDLSRYDHTQIPVFVDVAIFRIVRESATNVLRHATMAHRVSIVLANTRGEVSVRVADDGVVVPDADSANAAAVDAAQTSGGGHGIEGMRERAIALGGTLDAAPGPAGGFIVEAHIPTVSRQDYRR
jgi:signal transduction histidine kinase